MNTLIIIPAYNEAQSITAVISEVRTHFPDLDIVVVNDGSTDETAAFARCGGAKVLSLPFNLGYGGAVQAGLAYAIEAGYEVCVLMDGDGQHDPRFISDLLSPVLSGQADLALGSRFLGRADYKLPVGRKIGISLFSRLTSLVTRQQITDPTSGFQVIGRHLMTYFANDNYPDDYPDADTIIRLYFAGFRVKEVPVTIRPRLSGSSMHTGASSFYYVYKMLLSIFIALTEQRVAREGGGRAVAN
ncbi:MAG TPA: glycosyltransferase family 2 protein [Blastocatellia bacterium]|nr:glycosyltransferase family 2 protein [Blastocatellia bacterium]